MGILGKLFKNIIIDEISPKKNIQDNNLKILLSLVINKILNALQF